MLVISLPKAPLRYDPSKPATVILAIDPGEKQSAWVAYDYFTHRPLASAKEENEIIRERIRNLDFGIGVIPAYLVIERVAGYGRPVGDEMFETVYWSGKFSEAWEVRGFVCERVLRKEVKLVLLGNTNQKNPDGPIRQALIDQFGGQDVAIGKPPILKGKKKRPDTRGPLWDVVKDIWAALAVAVTFADRRGLRGVNLPGLLRKPTAHFPLASGRARAAPERMVDPQPDLPQEAEPVSAACEIQSLWTPPPETA